MNVTVRVDAAGVRRALSGLSAATSNRAIVRALNKTVTSTRTVAARMAGGATGELMLPYAKALQAVGVKKATPGGHLTQAEIIISPKDQEIMYFQARKAPRYGGVTFKIKRGGGRSLLKHAFIATMGSKTSVFVRIGKARVPVKMKFTSSVVQLFKRASIRERLKRAAAGAFVKEAQRQIQLALKTGSLPNS